MADGVVGVKQNDAPDRLIDNEVLTVGAQTVYRQRVSVGNFPTHQYHETLPHALAANETITSAWIDTENFAASTMFVYFYPVPPTSCTVQWSDDGINVSSAAPQAIEVLVSNIGIYSGFLSINSQSGRYVRIVTVNGATPQTLNQAIVWLLTSPYTGIFKALNASLPDYEVALLTRAVLAGQTPSGVYSNVQLTEQDDLRVGFNAFHIVPFNYTAESIPVGGSVTTAFEDVSNFADLQVATKSDQLIEGYVEWSLDGTTVNHNNTTPFIGGGDFHVPIGAQYARFRVVNLSASTCIFDLRVFGCYQATGLFTFPVAGPINDSFPAALTKTLITGKRPSGDYVNVPIGGEVSAISTNVLLPAGGTYTAPVVNCEGFATLGVTIQSDQPSAVGGLVLRWVEDVAGTVLLRSVPVTYSLAPEGMFFQVPIQGPYVQLVYMNGIIGQNVFTLHCQFDTASPNPMMQAIREPLVGQNTALTARSVTVLKDPTGNYPTAKATASGNLAVSLAESTTEQAIKSLSSWRTQQVQVPSDSAVRLAPTPFSGRRSVGVKNLGTGVVYLHQDSAVTAANSWVLDSKESTVIELDESAQLWALSFAGGASATGRRSGNSVINTGATNPNNVLASDDVRALLTATGQSVAISGFSAPGTYPDISNVKIGFEGRKGTGTPQTPIRQQGATNTSTGGTSLTTSSNLTAVAGNDYFCFVSMRASARSVTGVTGLGLTWSRLGAPVVTSRGAIELWRGTGTPTGDGSVTANFDTAVGCAAIAASRWSGLASIGATFTNSGTGTAWTVATTSATGTVIFAGAGLHGSQSNNDPGVDDTEYTDLNTGGTTGQRATMATQSRVVAGSNETTDGTWGTSDVWGAIAIVLTGAAAVNPTVTLSYKISGVPGPTTLVVPLSSATDTEYTVAIGGDQSFVAADITNLSVLVTGTSISANAEIDYVFIDITEAQTGGSQRVAVMEVGL